MAQEKRDYYEVLGVSKTATDAETTRTITPAIRTPRKSSRK